MITSFKNRILGKPGRQIPVVDRDFHIRYIRDEHRFAEYCRSGYTLIPNSVSPDHIRQIKDVYSRLTEIEGFEINEEFVNSGRFSSPEIRSYVMNEIGRISGELLSGIFEPGTYDPNTTGAFQIKPPSKKSALNPHQDSPVIDETTDHALFVWIPLCDINEENGPVWVLPGSHLWGNYQRSLNVPWVFEHHTKALWKYMKPISMKAGDVLCWDTALIHASTPNRSNETRLAITTTLLPTDFKMVEYYQDSMKNGRIEKYRVGRSFWESEDIMKRPSCPPNKLLETENLAFPPDTTRRELKELVAQTRISLEK